MENWQKRSFTLQWQEVNIIGRLAVDGQIVGLALPHKPWPSDAWVDGCTATVPLLKHTTYILGGQDSSLGISEAMGWTAGVWFPAGAIHFSVMYSVKSGSGVHPSSYPMGTTCCFLWSSWFMNLIIHCLVPRSRMVEPSLHSTHVSSWHGAYSIRHRSSFF
jgi:hypothetical protein